MLQGIGAERMARLMDGFYRSSYDVVISHDGIVDKFMGDACLALFNVPIRNPDHVQLAIRSGVGILETVRDLNDRRKGEPDLAIGVTISTGFALAGRIGSNRPTDYTAIGDVVNVAARLQEHAAAGEILVTREVFGAIAEGYPSARRREFQLKGITGLVSAYSLM